MEIQGKLTSKTIILGWVEKSTCITGSSLEESNFLLQAGCLLILGFANSFSEISSSRTAFWSHYLVHCWNSPSFSVVFGYFSKLKCRAFCSHLKPAPAFLRQQPESFPLFYTNKQTVVLRVELSWSHQEDCLLWVLQTYQLQSPQVQSLKNAPTRESRNACIKDILSSWQNNTPGSSNQPVLRP